MDLALEKGPPKLLPQSWKLTVLYIVIVCLKNFLELRDLAKTMK